MLYFGYGSNMPKARIERRLGPCPRLGAAFLTGYTLRFHKRGRDGSGKCDAFRTGDEGDRVWGALYRLTDAQISRLDGFERGYDRVAVEVVLGETLVESDLYVAKSEMVDSGLEPYDWYKDLVHTGAIELALPAGYIEAIAAMPSVPNRRRGG